MPNPVATRCPRATFGWPSETRRFPFTVFDFTTGHSAKEGPEPFFAGFEGYFHADGLKQYATLFAKEGVWHEALGTRSSEVPRSGLRQTGSGVDWPTLSDRAWIAAARHAEHIAQRRATRLAQSVPILDSLKAWLETESKNALPKSPLGGLAYVLSRWEAFVRYTEDGRLSVDNNLWNGRCEQSPWAAGTGSSWEVRHRERVRRFTSPRWEVAVIWG